MTSQKLIINFSNLKSLSSAEIIETIPPQTAVEETLKSIQNCEVSEQEIFKAWSTLLFKNYGPGGINNKDLKALFESFSVVIKKLLDESGNCQDDEQIGKLSEFLNYSLELFTWIHSNASDFEISNIAVFLCFGFFCIHSYLIVLSSQTSQVSSRKLIEKCLELHFLILAIFAENPNKFVFNAKESPLGKLITGLCSVGEITPKLDIKAAVETWKCIIRLASQNVQSEPHQNYDEDDVIWLSKPMSFLVKEIGRNVQTVYTQDSISEPIQQVEKYLKVTNFYLRLLHKLANDFRLTPFPICEEFLSTLVVVFNPPVYIVNTPVYKVVMDYIGNDLKELMPIAYRNHVFFEELLSEHSRNIYSLEAIHEVVLQTIDVIVRKDEPKYLSEKLLDASFACISSESFKTKSKTKYNEFVETLSSMQVTFNGEQIDKKLISTILHDNTTEALVAIDIWCRTFILSNHSTRQSYLKFWIDMNERFVTFSNSMSAFHTELLLKNLYALLPTPEKNEIWNKFNACMLRNERFFLAIGLEAIPSCMAKHSITQHFQLELLRLLKESRNGITVKNYYIIVRNLKLLQSTNFKNDDLIEILFEILELATENNKFYRIFESILEFLTPRIGYVDGNKLQRILTIISKNVSIWDEVSTKLSIIEFLKNAEKLSKLEKQSKEILKTLESDETIKLFMLLGESNSDADVDGKICDNLWKEIILKNPSMPKNQLSHVCRLKVIPENLTNHSRKDIEILLEALENNTRKLQTEGSIRQLSTSNLERINGVIFKLKEISKLDL